ncbi:hypothetical protein [Streptomyces sp. NEAU-YJ-81]|uniref:hypothetical protein n=1 Tax=Streptomyces sp. NEAU-YJ-81 TaxID=2820288 RepID=UPI001ABC55A2|nr:hypothetical protein [Streptomyces sp. NEAU-YJ-81]MBO3682834.1 hypothetical protein [Streptomyces sp. NEAU-YJ-81]
MTVEDLCSGSSTMTRSSSSSRPATAAALQHALAALSAAPTLDRTRRPHGPRPGDAPLLLGILLAKAELDAAVRADPGADPPEGLTELIRGYNTLARSEEMRLRLLALRLVRTAFDITVYEDTDDPCTPAAESAAMTAANAINAYRLARHSTDPADRRALAAALRSADEFNRSATEALSQAHHQLTPDT